MGPNSGHSLSKGIVFLYYLIRTFDQGPVRHGIPTLGRPDTKVFSFELVLDHSQQRNMIETK